MSKSEIVLQLTLKAIEYMSIPHANAQSGCEQANSEFSKQVCDFYNYLYSNLN